MIKSKILSATVIASIGAILLAWAPSAVYAGNNAAVVIKDGGCVLNGTFPSDQDVRVSTNSENGNRKLQCHFSGVPNDTGQALNLNVGCTWNDAIHGPTFVIGKLTITPSGKATATCIFKA